MSQQEYLRVAMELLKYTRRQLSSRIKVSCRTIDKWLLPEGSKDFRKMPAIARAFIDELLAKIR